MQGRFGGSRRLAGGLAALAVIVAGCEIDPNDHTEVTPSTPGDIALLATGGDIAQIEVVPVHIGDITSEDAARHDFGNGAVRLVDVESDSHPEVVLTERPGAMTDAETLPENAVAASDIDAISFLVHPIAGEELPYILLDVDTDADGVADTVVYAEHELAPFEPGRMVFRATDADWWIETDPGADGKALSELLEPGDTVVFSDAPVPTGIRIGLGTQPPLEDESFDGYVDLLRVELIDDGGIDELAAAALVGDGDATFDFEPDDVTTRVSTIPASGWTGSGADVVAGVDDVDPLTPPSDGALRLATAPDVGDAESPPGWAGTNELNGRSVADLGVLRYRTLAPDGAECAEPSLLVGVSLEAPEPEGTALTVPFLYHPCLETEYFESIFGGGECIPICFPPCFPLCGPLDVSASAVDDLEVTEARWRDFDTVPGLLSIDLGCTVPEGDCSWPPSFPPDECAAEDPVACGGFPLFGFSIGEILGGGGDIPDATIAPIGDVLGVDFGDAGVVLIAAGDPLLGQEDPSVLATQVDEADGSFVYVDSITTGIPGPGSTRTFDFAPGGPALPPPPAPPAGACPTAQPLTFHDVDPESTHAQAIACAASLGLLEGTVGGGYEPHDATTRGQMASLVARLLDHIGFDLPDGADAFGDDDDSVHESAINRLAAAGIANGTSSTTFSPTQPVSRAQLAAFLIRTYGLVTGEEQSGPDAFTDDDDSIHEPAIDAAAALGIVEGVGGGFFEPDGDVRRDQAASFLIRTLDSLIAGGHGAG